MDETDSTKTTTETVSSTKLLGIRGKTIPGVTRKLRRQDSVPITSVADMRTYEADDEDEGYVTMTRAQETETKMVREEVEEVDNYRFCGCHFGKTITQRIVAAVVGIMVLVIIVALESIIKGNVVDSGEILKAVKSEVDTLLDANVPLLALRAAASNDSAI